QELETEIAELRAARDEAVTLLEKMRVAEIRYRRLFEAAHDGVLLLDATTCEITDANPFMTGLLGRPRENLLGRQLFEIGLLKDAAASRAMVRKLQKDHEVRYENLPLKGRSGRRREVEVVANIYQENGRAVIQCNIRDITARKKSEAAHRRLNVLTASNLKLKREIIHRQEVERNLKKSEQEQGQLLKRTRLQQRQLRSLTHQMLHAQEEERKRISRELHDVIAQSLVGINMHLVGLAHGGADNPAGLQRRIARTRRLVENAVDIVHRFARELRPTMLDDLGLIPALQTFMKDFMEGTGIRASLKAFAGIERLPASVRTVLYRVAQEALANVARHSKASEVEVCIRCPDDLICMEIKDNGQGFDVDGASRARKNKRLGLLGMKERVEMIGGLFQVESTPGHHTTVRVEVSNKKSRGKIRGAVIKDP
ncbi:MAG: PAS domain-containing sensor histidine kinase, partial [Verrucomicrobiota bacterium]